MLVNVLWITTDHTTNPAWITIPGQTPGLKCIRHLHGMGDQLSIPLEDEVIGRRHTKAAFSLTIDAEQLRLRLPQLGDERKSNRDQKGGTVMIKTARPLQHRAVTSRLKK